jgi:hypothetical protein
MSGTLQREIGGGGVSIPYRLAGAPAERAGALHGERLALVLTAIAVALVPLLVPAGPSNVAPVDVVIGPALFACLLWAGGSGHRLRLPFAAAVGLLILGGAIGSLVGPVPTTGMIALTQDVFLLAWCWAIVNICHRPSNLRVLLAAWVYSAIVWSGLVLVGLATGSSALTGQEAHQGSRVQATLADPSYAGNYFFISIMLMWATRRPRRRGARYLAYAMLLLSLALTGSNSAMVAIIVGTALASGFGVYRRVGLMPMIAALSAIALVGAVAGSSISLGAIQDKANGSHISYIRDGLGRETSVEQRGMLLSESLRLFRAGSPLGEGPVSTKVRLHKEMAPFEKEAHDDYMAALIERGVIGFLGVLLLVGSLGRRTLSVATGKLTEGYAAVVVRPNALLGAVAGTAVAGLVYELFHVRHVWALFAFVAAVQIWGRR